MERFVGIYCDKGGQWRAWSSTGLVLGHLSKEEDTRACQCFKGHDGKSLITEICPRRLLQWLSARFFPVSSTAISVEPSHAKQRMAPVSVSSVLIRRAFVSSEGTRTRQIWTTRRPLDFVSRGCCRANYSCAVGLCTRGRALSSGEIGRCFRFDVSTIARRVKLWSRYFDLVQINLLLHYCGTIGGG